MDPLGVIVVGVVLLGVLLAAVLAGTDSATSFDNSVLRWFADAERPRSPISRSRCWRRLG
jgi:hypothetical protein